MTDSEKRTPKQEPEDLTKTDQAKTRRATLKKLGRFATVTAPTVTLLLAAQTKPSKSAAPSPSPCASSSRALKTAKTEIDTAGVLAGVAALPVDEWRYKPETGLEQQTHIGPYAEDFRAAFGVGDGVTISTIDAVGVCLAAIKALSQKVEALEGELREARRKTAA